MKSQTQAHKYRQHPQVSDPALHCKCQDIRWACTARQGWGHLLRLQPLYPYNFYHMSRSRRCEEVSCAP